MSAAGVIVDCEQRTADWEAARLGKVTASAVADGVLATSSKGEAASRKNYRAEKLVEILSGLRVEKHVTPEMRWGTEQEPFACAAYEMQQNVMVEAVGFVLHPFLPRFGCSPDGFVGDKGLVQFKCPNTAQHIGYLLAGVIPAEYVPQMLSELACTGREWCDLVSFDPRLPAHLQLFIRRLFRDDAKIADIEGKVMQFLGEVDDVLVQLGAAPTIVQSVPTEARQRRLLVEVKACLDFYFAGRAKMDEKIRLAACDLVFGVKSKDLLDTLPAEQLERGLRILHAYEKFPKHDLSSPETVLTQLLEAITEYDHGGSEEWEVPF